MFSAFGHNCFMKKDAKTRLYEDKLIHIDKNLSKLIKEKKTIAKTRNSPFFEI